MLGDKLISISLLSRAQLKDLGCALEANTCPTSLDFLNSTKDYYWLHDLSSIWADQWAYKTTIAEIGCYVIHEVRPVITVSKTIIKDA